MKRIINKLVEFLPFAFIITLIFGFIYVAVQQNYRQSANDPQIQIAEEIANTIHTDKSTKNLEFSQKTDLTTSLAAFLIVYDSNKKPILGTGYLDNALITPPDGTFDATLSEPSFPNSRNLVNGENRFTWQPKVGVRIAAVLVPVDKGTNGYVLVGRSLKEVEFRVDNLTKMSLFAWVVTILTTFGILLVKPFIKRVLKI